MSVDASAQHGRCPSCTVSIVGPVKCILECHGVKDGQPTKSLMFQQNCHNCNAYLIAYSDRLDAQQEAAALAWVKR